MKMHENCCVTRISRQKIADTNFLKVSFFIVAFRIVVAFDKMGKEEEGLIKMLLLILSLHFMIDRKYALLYSAIFGLAQDMLVVGHFATGLLALTLSGSSAVRARSSCAITLASLERRKDDLFRTVPHY